MKRTNNTIQRAENIANNLAIHKRYQKASNELEGLKQGRRPSLTLELLFANLDDHDRTRTLEKAIDTADSEAQRAYLIIESELSL